jgi:SNF2 family DNA or RNA helicase
MLDIFKQQKSFLTRAKEKSSFKYIIDFDSHGAFISVCDKKLKPLGEVDYRVYNGLDREILKLLNECQENNFFQISWERESSEIYLNSNPRLLELLRLSDKVFTYKDVHISFKQGIWSVRLKIIKKDKKYFMIPMVNDSYIFDFLTNSYVLIGDKILEVSKIGENFKQINAFHTSINESKLEEFLTILVTHFENIEIEYNGYKVENNRESKMITPAVIFEKITAKEELVLRTSATIGQLSPEFFNNFNITKVVLVNDLDKRISIYECDFSDVFEMYGTIFNNLTILKRGKPELIFSEEDGLFIINKELAGKFILNNLHSIITKCKLFGSEKLKAYKYNTSKPALNVNFKDKIDFLDRDDISVSIDEEQFDIFDMINLYKKHAYIPLQNGEKSIVDKEYMEKLERVFKKKDKKVKVSFFDLPEIEDLISQKEQKVFNNSRSFYEGFNLLKSSKERLPKLEGIKLREYQKHGIKWMKYLYDNQLGGCLADDMGLGKTVQAITLLSYIYPKSKMPSLIIMPRSLLSNWQKELDKFNPNITYHVYHGTDRDSNNIKKYNIIFTTYAIARNDIAKLKEIEFDTIILDESQNIKNLDSKISKAIILLDGKHRFALSGTPIENSLFELYSLFRFLNTGMFSTISDFKRDFAIPIQSDNNENVAKLLRAKISPFLLRRLKKDVLTELPAKQEQVIYVDMNDGHKKLYEEKRDYYKGLLNEEIETNGIDKSKFVILQAFSELRQIASAPELKTEKSVVSSKVEQLFEMLIDIVANGHKVLIFANFLGSLDLIASKAQSMGIEHLMMTGSTRDRESLVEKFQQDKRYSLFLMTLKVGGVGLNLTEADYVFIFDPWWNKSAENQAIDRAHRMGQKNRVFAYKMITKGTIEEKILELQMRKQDVTDMVISGDEGGLKQLSSSDLDYILG